MEWVVLALFCGVLLVCLGLGLPVLWALGVGLVLFGDYALRRGFSLREVRRMCWEGIREAKTVLLTFALIGILTALWRAAGTIPAIICYASALFVPSLFLTVTFVLTSLVSFLTGTAFGTAATMGVICATMASAMGISPVLAGGAILSGCYFGDRCSPVSTSALLVAEVTRTDLFSNIRGMLRTGAVPFALSCALYTAIGLVLPRGTVHTELLDVFRQGYRIGWAPLLPAAVIVVLSLFRVRVRLTMLASILCAVPVAVGLQGCSAGQLLRWAVLGYTAPNAALGRMINGGGMAAMVNVAAIVCLSSAYSGIFRRTGLLHTLQQKMQRAAGTLTPFGAVLTTAVLTAMLSCNQTLTILLTNQLCAEVEPKKERLALALENTAVVVAPLVPWSIAGAVPLASVSAPARSVAAACFLYLLPICQLAQAVLAARRTRHAATP